VSRRGYEKIFESDGTYFLKLVIFVLLGTLWLKFSTPITWLNIPLHGVPLGLLIGLILVNRFERYQSDRKIWYAILLVVSIICYFAPAGVVI
jgi:predicted membrane chloride channel (bestrophin family)